MLPAKTPISWSAPRTVPTIHQVFALLMRFICSSTVVIFMQEDSCCGNPEGKNEHIVCERALPIPMQEREQGPAGAAARAIEICQLIEVAAQPIYS